MLVKGEGHIMKGGEEVGWRRGYGILVEKVLS